MTGLRFEPKIFHIGGYIGGATTKPEVNKVAKIIVKVGNK